MKEMMLAQRNVIDLSELPGPKEITKSVSSDLGYFGITTASELASGDAIASAVGLAAGTSINPLTDWMKFWYKGKVLYIPKKPIRGGATWTQLNAAGVTAGKMVKIAEIDFVIRLMSGATSNPGVTNGAGGEWNDLMYRISSEDPTATFWERFSIVDLQLTSTANQFGATWCVEGFSGGWHIYRGFGSITNYNHDLPGSNYQNYGWRPVLEFTP